jgi:hypothetical protein
MYLHWKIAGGRRGRNPLTEGRTPPNSLFLLFGA